MNLKKNFLILYILFNIVILSIINFKNTNKIKINIFTRQTNNLSIGNVVTYSYFAGASINAILTLLIISSEISPKIGTSEKDSSNFNEFEDEATFKEKTLERPPERDIKDSQPTISVKYRVIENEDFTEGKIDREINRKSSGNNIDEDWEENDADW